MILRIFCKGLGWGPSLPQVPKQIGNEFSTTEQGAKGAKNTIPKKLEKLKYLP